MTETYTYTQYLPSVVQGVVLSRCKRHVGAAKSLTVYRKNGHLVYEAFWRRFIMIHLVWDVFDRTSQSQQDFETFCYIMENDLDRVITDAAIYTWLCIDGTSIKDKFPQNNAIPKSLYNGLVLKYYEPTMRICAFGADLTYVDEVNRLNKKTIEAADEYAWTCLKDKLDSLNLTEEKAEILVRKHIRNRSESLERI